MSHISSESVTQTCWEAVRILDHDIFSNFIKVLWIIANIPDVSLTFLALIKAQVYTIKPLLLAQGKPNPKANGLSTLW